VDMLTSDKILKTNTYKGGYVDELTYFVGYDLLAIRTIMKGNSRGCDIAIHKGVNYVIIFVLTEVSLPDMGFADYNTMQNGNRPSFFTPKSKDEVLEILSKHFRLVNKGRWKLVHSHTTHVGHVRSGTLLFRNVVRPKITKLNQRS